jgi:polysaccharide biosynthesis transport protein
MPSSERVDMSWVLRAIKRRLPVILLCALLLPAAAVFFSLRQEKEYTASASLLFRDPGFAQTLFGSSVLTPGTDANRDAATNTDLLNQPVVAAATARALGNGVTSDRVKESVSASSEGQSDIITVRATDHSPTMAATMANTYAQQFILLRQAADRAKIKQGEELLLNNYRSLTPLERQTPRGQDLQQQLDKLQTLESIQTGNAELSQPADIPTSPSSPKPVRNGILGGVLGLIVGLLAAFLLERADRKVREPDELQEAFGRPLLGLIPKSRAIAKSGKRGSPLPPGDAEAFRMLRASLQYFDVDSEVRSVVVTSPSAGDGKTTVAWNLAAAAAGSGTRVLLVEADLRHPVLAPKLPVPPGPGLSEYLSGQTKLDAAIEPVLVPNSMNGASGGRSMDVITAGQVPPNPVDLMESARMERLIDECEREYDLVIIDTPPTSVVSDAVPLLKQVSGVVVVSRVGVTTRHAMMRLRDQLTNVGARTLGIVVNGAKPAESDYGYYAQGAQKQRHPQQAM